MSLRTIIPPKHGRPSEKPAKGRYRRLMQTRFDEQKYRKRAQVETVMSMIKRRQGSYCKGKTYWSRCRELNLMVLTHNIMILLPTGTFLQSRCVPFYSSLFVRKRLDDCNFLQSMSRKGNCYDNAPMESFFKSFKVEEVYHEKYESHEQAVRAANDYIERFYNPKRLHSALSYVSPNEFEQRLLLK